MVEKRLGAGLLPLALGGCNLLPEAEGLPGVQEVLRQEAGKVVTGAVVGNLVGLVGGFLLGWLAWQGFRALARHTGRPDPWHGHLFGMLLLLACTILGGYLGLLQGGRNAVRTALRAGPIGTELLPEAGNAGADLLFRVDQFLGKSTDNVDAALARFRAGKQKLDVVDLGRRLDRLESASGKELADLVKKRIMAEHPEWRGKLQETLLGWVLPRLAQGLARSDLPDLRDELDIRPFFQDLVAEARAAGDKDGMTRDAVSRFFVDRVVAPDILASLDRQTATIERWLLYGLAAIVAAALALGLVVRALRPQPSP